MCNIFCVTFCVISWFFNFHCFWCYLGHGFCFVVSLSIIWAQINLFFLCVFLCFVLYSFLCSFSRCDFARSPCFVKKAPKNKTNQNKTQKKKKKKTNIKHKLNWIQCIYNEIIRIWCNLSNKLVFQMIDEFMHDILLPQFFFIQKR